MLASAPLRDSVRAVTTVVPTDRDVTVSQSLTAAKSLSDMRVTQVFGSGTLRIADTPTPVTSVPSQNGMRSPESDRSPLKDTSRSCQDFLSIFQLA